MDGLSTTGSLLAIIAGFWKCYKVLQDIMYAFEHSERDLEWIAGDLKLFITNFDYARGVAERGRTDSEVPSGAEREMQELAESIFSELHKFLASFRTNRRQLRSSRIKKRWVRLKWVWKKSTAEILDRQLARCKLSLNTWVLIRHLKESEDTIKNLKTHIKELEAMKGTQTGGMIDIRSLKDILDTQTMQFMTGQVKLSLQMEQVRTAVVQEKVAQRLQQNASPRPAGSTAVGVFMSQLIQPEIKNSSNAIRAAAITTIPVPRRRRYGSRRTTLSNQSQNQVRDFSEVRSERSKTQMPSTHRATAERTENRRQPTPEGTWNRQVSQMSAERRRTPEPSIIVPRSLIAATSGGHESPYNRRSTQESYVDSGSNRSRVSSKLESCKDQWSVIPESCPEPVEEAFPALGIHNDHSGYDNREEYWAPDSETSLHCLPETDSRLSSFPAETKPTADRFVERGPFYENVYAESPGEEKVEESALPEPTQTSNLLGREQRVYSKIVQHSTPNIRSGFEKPRQSESRLSSGATVSSQSVKSYNSGLESLNVSQTAAEAEIKRQLEKKDQEYTEERFRQLRRERDGVDIPSADGRNLSRAEVRGQLKKQQRREFRRLERGNTLSTDWTEPRSQGARDQGD